VKRLPTYKQFIDESDNEFNLNDPSRTKALELHQGDQVIDKTDQAKGVGMIISINHATGVALIHFYDDLKNSTFNQNLPYYIPIKKLFAVAAQEN
jgi:hypothetical protein